MRLIRREQTWRVVNTFARRSYCLEQLAFRVSYRVAELCAVLGCSHRLLYEVFMRDIGLPPKTWMDFERMVVARRMIESGKAVREVAQVLGFMSPEAFRRKFAKVYGISPGRFQRNRLTFDPQNPAPPDWRRRFGLDGGVPPEAG